MTLIKKWYPFAVLALAFSQIAIAGEKTISCLTVGMPDQGKTTGVRLAESDQGQIYAYVSDVTMLDHAVVSVGSKNVTIAVEKLQTPFGMIYFNRDDSFILYFYPTPDSDSGASGHLQTTMSTQSIDDDVFDAKDVSGQLCK
jgi:hypothetical protein